MPPPTVLVFLFIFCFLTISVPLSCLTHGGNNAPRRAYISKPSINLRATTRDATPSFEYDAMQNTQLLLGDRVDIVRQVNEYWYEVRAVDQARFSNGTWHGYDGFLRTSEVWVQRSDSASRADSSHFAIVQVKRAEIFDGIGCFDPGCLKPAMEVSMGTIFRYINTDPHTAPIMGWFQVGTEDSSHKWFIKASDVNIVDKLLDDGKYPFVMPSREAEDRLRQHILEASFKLLGSVYFWGGRSSYSWKDFMAPLPGEDKCLSGVDCSGLVGLSHQTLGYILPRDAHDMYLRSERFDLAEGKGGDLFFFEKPATKRIVHVMMMIDEVNIIESTSGVNASRVVSMEERFGAHYGDLQWGMMVEDTYKLYWGRYIKS